MRHLGFTIVGTALLLSSCQKKEQEIAALASVNDQPITEETFLHWYDSSQSKEDLLEKLIDRSATVQLARKAGLDKDPAVVAEIESLLISKLREREILSAIKSEVTDSEIETYYENHSDQFTQASRLKVSVLWFDTRGQAPLEARYRPRLEEALEKFNGSDFKNLSINYSEHKASRYKGGQLGWLETERSYDMWTNSVLEIAQNLPSGKNISEITVNPQGSFLVSVTDQQDSGQRPLASVRKKIIHDIKLNRRQSAEAAFQNKIKSSATIVLHQDRLDQLDLPKPPQTALVTSRPTQP